MVTKRQKLKENVNRMIRRKSDGLANYWIEEKDGRVQITIQLDAPNLKRRLGVRPTPQKVRSKKSAPKQVNDSEHGRE